MKVFLMRRASVLAVPVITCLGWTHAAFAQAAPEAPAAAPAAPAAAPAAPAAAPAPPPAPKWYDKAKIEGFVDTYFSLNFNNPKPQTGTNLGRAFDVSNGFALNWVGLNASYAPDPVGAFVGLRFGPGATIYNGSGETGIGAGNIKEAYVSWKPASKFQIDFGKFSTWIGAEVTDTQYNMTYTRSFLFFTQPVFHTGIRLDFPVADQFDLKLYAVNGYNNSQDNNAGKTFGATATIMPTKDYTIYVNYIGGPEQSDIVPAAGATTPATADTDANSRWKHLIDVVADLHFDKAHLLVNGDYGTEKVSSNPSQSHSWYGVSATIGYAVSDQFALALRGGYFGDPDGYQTSAAGLTPAGSKASVIDASLTLAAMPTPNLIIKLEPRIDSASSDAPGFSGQYPKGFNDAPSKTEFTTTLGVVATTN